MSNLKVNVDSGQILIIKRELVKDFVINEFNSENKKEFLKRLNDNNLTACYSDCCAVTLYSDQTKVTDGVYCVNTLHGDGTYYFEVNPDYTECYGDFIGFTEESTGFMYTVDNKYEGDDPEEDPCEYVELEDQTGIVNIKESGEYIIGDPCSISEKDAIVYLEAGKYDICFFENRVDYDC